MPRSRDPEADGCCEKCGKYCGEHIFDDCCCSCFRGCCGCFTERDGCVRFLFFFSRFLHLIHLFNKLDIHTTYTYIYPIFTYFTHLFVHTLIFKLLRHTYVTLERSIFGFRTSHLFNRTLKIHTKHFSIHIFTLFILLFYSLVTNSHAHSQAIIMTHTLT